MSGVFVGVFEILKKERNESKKKEREKEEIEWFVASQRRRRHKEKVKQGERCPRTDCKGYENLFQCCLNSHVSEDKNISQIGKCSA